MSKQQSFTREEVYEILIAFFKAASEDYTGILPFIGDEHGNGGFPSKEGSMYNSIYGKTMSILETAVDKEKLEPSKTIARQLLNDSRHEAVNRLTDIVNYLIDNSPTIGYGAPWGDIRALLH